MYAQILQHAGCARSVCRSLLSAWATTSVFSERCILLWHLAGPAQHRTSYIQRFVQGKGQFITRPQHPILLHAATQPTALQGIVGPADDVHTHCVNRVCVLRSYGERLQLHKVTLDRTGHMGSANSCRHQPQQTKDNKTVSKEYILALVMSCTSGGTAFGNLWGLSATPPPCHPMAQYRRYWQLPLKQVATRTHLNISEIKVVNYSL